MISGVSNEEQELARFENGSWCISKEQLDYFVSLEKQNTELREEIKQLKNDNAVMKVGLIQIRDEQLELYKQRIDKVIEVINT